jgi:ABC-2 type transport system ATP-binding protein
VAALTDLTLEVPAGSVFGFLGPNGAGKTTALRILAGLTRSTSGSAAVNGVPVSVQGAHRADVGFLAQEPRFYGWMSGRQTLAYVASFYGRNGSVDASRPRLDELLELVGLTDAADRPTKTYSGGMRQRLGIAQALVGNASVLLLDEPAAALDPIGRHDVLKLMQRLRGDKTIFYSTHILDDVQRVSDHVAILDHGRLVVSAPTADVMNVSKAGTLQVTLAGAADLAGEAIATLPGVTGVSTATRSGEEWRFEISVHDGESARVQRAITRYAADADLTVISNRQESLDLEEAFLRIVNKERAA